MNEVNGQKNTGNHEDGNKFKIIIASYLFLSAAILIIVSVLFWPSASQITSEKRLIVIVAVFGALGSLVHALRSFNWHVIIPHDWGISWLLRYLLLPPTGAAIAMIFYAVIRAGFIKMDDAPGPNLPWIMAAVASLVGMFREAAASKLKDIAQAVLKKPSDPVKDSERKETGGR